MSDDDKITKINRRKKSRKQKRKKAQAAGSLGGEGKKSGRVYQIVAIVCMICAAICLGIFAYQQIRKQQATDALDDLKEDVVTTVTDATEEAEDDWDYTYDKDVYEATGQMMEARSIDWDTVHAENEDVYAWIYIPNTNIDYPVLQDPDSNDFYLMHNLDGSSGYPGCIYSEPTYNTTDFTDPMTVLYGHNMKNKSMFATLHSFDDETFFAENRYIYVYLPNGHTLVYEIWAATVFTDAHILYNYDFSTEEGFMGFIEMILADRESSNHFDDTAAGKINADSHILTLSTCISTKPNNRWLVMGNLLNPDKLEG